MLITLKEYAERHGRCSATARQKALRGGFKTAQKIGWQWFIDENEPYCASQRGAAAEENERPGGGMVTVAVYAAQHHKNKHLVFDKIKRGEFKTARKVGMQWMLDADEPYIDRRKKTGAYVGWRKGERGAK